MGRGVYPDRDPQLFYELARDRHATQADLLNSLDSKLIFFLSGSSGLLGLLVAVYTLRPNAFDDWKVGVAVASGVAWVVLTAFALHALWAAIWRLGPKLPEVFDRHFTTEDDRTLKWRVANHFWHDFNHNKPLENRKARALRWAQWLFVSQTLLLVAALALAARSGSDTTPRCQSPFRAARDAQAPARVQACRSALVPVPQSWRQDHKP
jgi:hypothetical protein